METWFDTKDGLLQLLPSYYILHRSTRGKGENYFNPRPKYLHMYVVDRIVILLLSKQKKRHFLLAKFSFLMQKVIVIFSMNNKS